MESELKLETKSGPPDRSTTWSEGWPQTREEFSRFVDCYLSRLVQYAFRRLFNLHDAEDIVQEVMVRAYADRKKHAHITVPGPYLYRMTANACTSHLRARQRSHAMTEALRVETSLVTTADPSREAAAKEELTRADELIRRLPEKQAEAVRLRVWDELPLHEIAEVLGCSLNTVGSRLRYGFKKLRDIITDQQGVGR